MKYEAHKRREIFEMVAKKAAQWWGDIIVDPEQDNGAGDLGNFIANKLKKSMNQHVTSEQKELFINIFAAIIESHLYSYGRRIDVANDYGCSPFLKVAFKYSGIPSENFPIKTWLIIEHNIGESEIKMIAKYTYNGKIENLLEGEENEQT